MSAKNACEVNEGTEVSMNKYDNPSFQALVQEEIDKAIAIEIKRNNMEEFEAYAKKMKDAKPKMTWE